MEPTLGRIVHVTWPDGVQSPAIVTRTNADTAYPLSSSVCALVDRWGASPVTDMAHGYCDLMVFGLAQVYPLYDVPMASMSTPHHWHWPERELEPEPALEWDGK